VELQIRKNISQFLAPAPLPGHVLQTPAAQVDGRKSFKKQTARQQQQKPKRQVTKS